MKEAVAKKTGTKGAAASSQRVKTSAQIAEMQQKQRAIAAEAAAAGALRPIPWSNVVSTAYTAIVVLWRACMFHRVCLAALTPRVCAHTFASTHISTALSPTDQTRTRT